MRRGLLIAIATPLVLLVLGLLVTRPVVESQLPGALEKRIGQGSYRVTLEDMPWNILRGHVSHMAISGWAIHLHRGLKLSQLELTLDGVVFSPSTRTLHALARSHFETTITAADALEFVKLQAGQEPPPGGPPGMPRLDRLRPGDRPDPRQAIEEALREHPMGLKISSIFGSIEEGQFTVAGHLEPKLPLQLKPPSEQN